MAKKIKGLLAAGLLGSLALSSCDGGQEPDLPPQETISNISPTSGISPLEVAAQYRCSDDKGIREYRIIEGNRVTAGTSPIDTTLTLLQTTTLQLDCTDTGGQTASYGPVTVEVLQPSYSQTISLVNNVDLAYSAILENVDGAVLAYLRENGDTLATRAITTPTFAETFTGARKGSYHFILSAPGLTPDTAVAAVSQFLPTINFDGLVTDLDRGNSLTIDLESRVSDINPEDNPVPIISATPLIGGIETTLDGYLLAIEGNWPGAYEVEIRAGSDEGGIEARTLSGTVTSPPCGTTPVSGKIAFVRVETRASSDDASNRDIYLMNRDGSNQVNLTNEPGEYYPLDFSPDGKWIAFENARDVYIMSPDGTCLRNLTAHPSDDWTYNFSPDGGKIAFQSNRDGNVEIYVVNVDGGGLTNLTNHPEHDHVPSWSPDGSRIAFRRSDDLYIMNSDGSNQRSISTTRTGGPSLPQWSFDGNKIAFVKWNDEGPLTNNTDIYVINSDGTGLRRVTSGYSPSEIRWSQESNNLLFSSAWDRAQDIYVIHDFGEVGERLERFRIPGNDFDARWSPDGLEFSFVSSTFGNWEIMRFQPDWDDLSLSVLTRLTTNSVSDHQPRWSP